MTVQSPPAYLQAGTYTAISDRLHLVTIENLKDGADAFRAYQGFFPDRFPAYSNPSGMNWSIGPCAGVTTNTFVSGGGDYKFANPSNITGSFAASSPTLNRYDILGFQVQDNFYDSSGFNQIVPAVIQGANSAGTPVDPALPSTFIPIARAVVNAGVTSPTLQDLRTRTVPTAAMLPIASTTARTALGTPYAGFQIYRLDRNWVEVYDGAAWRVQGVAVCSSTADRDSAITTPYLGQYAVTTDTRTLWIYNGSAWVTEYEKLLTSFGVAAVVSANETTTSATYVNLTTTGPSVTMTSSGTRALIWWSAHGFNNTANCGAISSIDVSGATTQAVADGNGILWNENDANLSHENSQFMVVTITPGSNTFRVMYKRAAGGTASFERRRMYVLAP